MSTFFDRKEEVIDLKLTRYGRTLLSLGKFKPEYYSFYDDDLIYDNQFGGHPPVTGSLDSLEEQNNIAKRIKETPRIKIQTAFSGVETEITELNEHFRAGNLKLGYGGIKLIGQLNENEVYTLEDKYLYNLFSPKLQSNAEKTMFSAMPLGKSQIGGRYKPSWDVKSLKAPITTTIAYYQGDTQKLHYVQVPQIEIEHTIKTFNHEGGDIFQDGDFPDIAMDSEFSDAFPLVTDTTSEEDERTISSIAQEGVLDYDPKFGKLASRLYDDGTYLTQKQEFVFLDVIERNVDFARENFDIEVFRVEKNPDGTETTIPLSFFNETMLDLTSNEDEINEAYTQLDDSYVEYYFEINVDKEIGEDILCDVDLRNKKRNFFVDYELDYVCPDDEIKISYDKDVVDPEEPC